MKILLSLVSLFVTRRMSDKETIYVTDWESHKKTFKVAGFFYLIFFINTCLRAIPMAVLFFVEDIF